MVANAALGQQAIDSESVGLRTHAISAVSAPFPRRFFEHRDQMATDHLPRTQLLRRMIR